MATRPTSLVDYLVDRELVTREALAEVIAETNGSKQPLRDVLVERGLVTPAQMMQAVAGQMGIEFVDLSAHPIDTMAASLLPDALARRHAILPIGFDDQQRLRVAMADPANVLAIDDVRTMTGHRVQPVAATREDVLAAIGNQTGLSDAVESVVDEDDFGDGAEQIASLGEDAEDAPIVKFVNAVIQQAVQSRASDIHIEPGERDLRVRFRVDGVLHEISSQHRSIHAGVVSRLKIMADMDIAERRVPQDGRISVRVNLF